MHRGHTALCVHRTMPELTWFGNCYACKAPLDIILFTENDQSFKFIEEHVNLRIFYDNDSRFKFFGPTARSVCKACFDNYNQMKKTRNIRNIERGKFPRLKKSFQQAELKAWFGVLKKSWESYNK